MKTLFDLRDKPDTETHKAIQRLFDEPIKIVGLGDIAVTACSGCWSCWLNTPGICAMKDQMSAGYSDYVNSSTVILLMNTAQGFIDHRAKAFLDRSIPHYHPYIELVDGECHHVARYDGYPDMVFLYDTEGVTNQEEQIIEDYLYRTAYHFKSTAYRIVQNEVLELRLLEPRKAKRQQAIVSSMDPMDRLIIYSGSPRRKTSNSALILQQTAEALGDKVEIRDLRERDKWELWAASFKEDEHVMFFMPLYVHAMPSHVMAFMERLQTASGSISFFIQSGFPESSQSHYLEAYFEQLALRLGRTYLGTAIKGGVEGLQMRPPKAQLKMAQTMVAAIENLVNKGKFDHNDILRLSRPVHLGMGVALLFKLLKKIGLLDYYWDTQLKANGAYENRFDRPYELLTASQ